MSPAGTRQQITENFPTNRTTTMPEGDKTRERSPANLNIKYNPTLGASNAKRFQASVRTLLKTSAQNGELALAVLEGSADSSKESLVLFEPRALD